MTISAGAVRLAFPLKYWDGLHMKTLSLLVALVLPLVAYAGDQQSVTLHFAYRHAQTVEIEQKKTVCVVLAPLTGSDVVPEIMTDDVRALTFGDMAVEVQVYPYAVLLHVADAKTKRPITTLNYEPTEKLQNQFGGFGFTGLHYVYHPRSDAELQFWAEVEWPGVRQTHRRCGCTGRLAERRW